MNNNKTKISLRDMLIKANPLILNVKLAEKIGLNNAIVLQQIQYWLDIKEKSGNRDAFINGRWWVYNTMDKWAEQFPFWSKRTIERIIADLRKRGLISIEKLSSNRDNRTNYYSINYGADENEVPVEEENIKKNKKKQEKKSTDEDKKEKELIQYWVDNVYERVKREKGYSLTKVGVEAKGNISAVKKLIKKIKSDGITRDGITDPFELAKFIFDNQTERWIDAKPFNGQNPLEWLAFSTLVRPTKSIDRIQDVDRRKKVSNKGDWKKTAMDKLSSRPEQGEEGFFVQNKIWLSNLTSYELCYLIIQGIVVPDDVKDDETLLPSEEIFREVALREGLLRNTDKDKKLLECD